MSAATAGIFAVGCVLIGGTGVAQAEKSCGFEFTFTRPTVLGPQILGRGVAQCDVTPSEHVLTLSLQRWEAGRWEPVSHRTSGALPPGPPSYTSYEVSAACYAGLSAPVTAARDIRTHP
ncbi:hypothetical protein ACTD5D_22920 [Nocardia takedensis]|uniref:hypothetical protein n=1 Tax=Nocardia takedensis TaxID=259390 RepID=UPI003F768501